MKLHAPPFVAAVAATVVSFLLLLSPTTSLSQHKPAGSIPATALLQPAELAASLNSASEPRPLILQVGSHVLYAEAHIVGSEYAGPGGQGGGLQLLRERVGKVSKDAPIVIYCGCCPWTRCPNIAPAYDELRALGFTHVTVLYIADNFGANWIDPGYPVDKGR